MKGSLDFAFNKIDDLEKSEKEHAEIINKTVEQLESLTNANMKLKVDAQRNKGRNIKAEAYSRRQNLRFEGIPQSQNESPTDCRNAVYDIIRRNLEITDVDQRIVIEKCHRDKKYPNQDPPSMLVRFLSLRDRKDKLNRNRDNKLFINEDFPQEVEKKRSFLRPYLKAAYATKRRATLSGDTLIVESLKYTVNTLDQLPDDMKPEKVAVKRSCNITSFFRSDAFLSNFHAANFEIGNKAYNSVEQYYMSQKAATFEDHTTKNQIMASKNPYEINFLSKNIKNFDQGKWNKQAMGVMRAGVYAKFEQNPKLKKLLLETENTILAEASQRDKFGGIGLHINDPKVNNQKNWVGRNNLGKILMECRESLS